MPYKSRGFVLNMLKAQMSSKILLVGSSLLTHYIQSIGVNCLVVCCFVTSFHCTLHEETESILGMHQRPLVDTSYMGSIYALNLNSILK